MNSMGWIAPYTKAASLGRSAPARLDRPPAPESRARLPLGFGQRYCIFGDAEEEFDWTAPLARESTSTAAIASLPEANRHFLHWGAVATYLVDYPVVDNPASAATMRAMAEAGECEIGTQLHPWVTPPYAEEVIPANSFAGNLPIDLERAKLLALHHRITDAIGEAPRIYRAGRYGIGPNTAALLEEAGYRLDVSVRALFDYSEEGGPDFSAYPIWPWWLSARLLELPLTAAFTGRWHNYSRLHRTKWSRSAFARMGLLNRVALTPEGMPLAEVLEAIERLLDTGTQLFSLSFHTPSVEVGHTPYVRDKEDLRQFWHWWDAVLGLFARKNVLPVRASEIIAAADEARPS